MRLRRNRQPFDRLRIGYVKLNDCAPLVMARELGLFERYGLNVELSREVGWATVRDKVLLGELDAAHALAGMVLAASFGVGSVRVPSVTGLVLNLHGNAITLSSRLRSRGVTDGASLARFIRKRSGLEPLTFGAVFSSSSHHFLLRRWLAANDIDPDRDVQIAIVPPPQMERNLKAGHLDGYCVGEPWNSMAVMSGAGFCVATSADLAPGHVEKVLMVREDFAETRREEHVALVAALYEACTFCAAPQNRERIIETLAEPQYLDFPPHVLRMSMMGTFNFGLGRIEKVPQFNIFAGGDTNVPTPEKAASVLEQLKATGVLPDPEQFRPSDAAQCFRGDLFNQATQLLNS